MTDPLNPTPSHAHDASDGPDHDLTVDLTLDGSEPVEDLQALADEAAQGLPETKDPGDGDASALITEELERTLAEAQGHIQDLEKREAEHRDKHHRLLADFANYRNRTARDIQMAVDLSERKLLLEILPILDNFERCIGSTYQSVEDFRTGVQLIQKQFTDALRRMGVEDVKLEPGDAFDALHAEALSTTTVPELPDGSVAVIYERGYMLKDKLLRAAKVIVNRLPG